MRPSLSRATAPTIGSLLILFGSIAPCLSSSAVLGQSSAVAQAAPKALYIDILEGEGEMNDIRARTAREPIVQINDENHKPVAGALVLFSLDTNGSSKLVSFGQSQTVSVRTGADGRAVAHNFQVLHKTGQVRILVHAVVGTTAADAVITQTNYAPGSKLRRSISNHKVLLGSAAVVAAAVAIIVVNTDGGSGATIQPGTGVVRGVRPAK